MEERNDKDGGGASLPTSASSRKPTIIRPATKLLPDPPPRPTSTPQVQSATVGSVKARNQTNNRKLEITIVDARPMSEMGPKDVKVPEANSTSVKDHPSSSGDSSTHNTSAREQPGGDSSTKIGLPTWDSGDREGDDDEGDREVVSKPLLQLRPQRPTIIRPQSRLQSTTDLTPAIETESAPIPQRSSSASTSIVATIPPSVPGHPLPSPKPRLRDQTSVSTDSQMPIQISAERKHTPPTRPPSIQGPGLLSQNPPSGQPSHPVTSSVSSAKPDKSLQMPPARPPSMSRPDLSAHKSPSVEWDTTTSTNSYSTSPAQVQPPRRPSGPPIPNVLGSPKPKDKIEVKSKPVSKSEVQIPLTVPTSVDNPEVSSPPNGTWRESAGIKLENSENKSELPKPKPRPKPRPISISPSPAIKEETPSIPADNIYSRINKQLSHSNQTTSHDTQQKSPIPNSKPSPATSTDDKADHEEQSPAPERPKPLTTPRPVSTIIAAKPATSQAKEMQEEDVEPLTTAPPMNTKPGPAVHRPTSTVSHLQQTPLSQLPSVASGEPNAMPSPPRRNKHKASAAHPSPVPQRKPPPRPETSATAKIKSPLSSEKPPLVSEKPPLSSEKPPLVSEKPSLVSEKSPLVSEKPPLVSEKPPLVSEKPPLVSEKPPLVSEKPPLVSEKPPLVSEKPPLSSEKLPPVNEKPPLVSEKSPFSSDKPSLVGEKSPLSSDKPSFVSEKSPFSSDKPSLVSEKSPLSSERPLFVNKKPSSASEKPPQRSDNVSSSHEGTKVELAAPSKPAASRVKQVEGAPPLPKRPCPGHPLYSYMSREPHGLALFDYTASQPDELTLSKGDVVIMVRDIDADWRAGQVGGNAGMFPAAFVEMVYPAEGKKSGPHTDNLDSRTASARNESKDDSLTGPRCRARFDFEADGETELPLQDGDVVQIIEKIGDEWLRGQHRGRHGIFPTSFVEVIEDLPPGGSTGGNMAASVSALFDFDGKDGELTFKAGDKISEIHQINSEWLFGQCNGQKGQFPASFVSGLPANLPKLELDMPAGHLREKQKAESNKNTKDLKVSTVPAEEFWDSRESALGFCIGMFDYNDPSLGDLGFKVGDRIKILEFIGEDWARGRLGNKEGLFPLRFVAEELNSPPRTPEPEVVVKVWGKVVHDFDGETVDDLTIKEGDIIEVGDFADINKHWRWGTLNGQKGMFPVSFVDILDE